MAKIGTFKIEDCFVLTGRGLIVLGQIVDGVVKTGAYTNVEVGNGRVDIQISEVDIADIRRDKGKFAVGISFFYQNELQRKEFEKLKLKEQLIDIVDEPATAPF